MRKSSLLLTGILVLLAAPAFAADPADAPRQALLAFVDASHAGDLKAMQAALDVQPANKDQVATLLGMYQAAAQLRTSINAKFGAEAKRAGWADAASETRKKTIETADVKVTDDHAVITVASPAGDDNKLPREIVCKKTGETWKVDAVSLFALSEPTAKASIARLQKMSDLFTQVAKDVDTGKLGTLQAAQRAVAEGAKALADQDTPPAERPATRP